MRALGVTTFGGPDKITVLDVPVPHPGADEIRIRVQAATVNPTDNGTVSGAYGERMSKTGPWVPGAEAAGVVSEIGTGVTRFAVGDRVLAVVVPYSAGGGSWTDELIVPAAQAVAIPDGIEFAAAATLPMNALTAWLILDILDVPAGGSVAVTGSAGAFGGYVVQLAKSRGLRVIADAKEADVALIRALGADDVVERGPGFATAVRAVLPDGVDGLADGSLQGEELLPAVRDGGIIGTIRGWSGNFERGIKAVPTLVYDHASTTSALEELVGLVAQGALTLRVADVLPAERAAEALTRLNNGGVRGRLVLDFS